jgi:thiol-disulfide isomerase/thioredoxin|tara:strand:+ start:96 stop:407 length:312 start_codon:yes stop_codon:yes gene_type:complete
MRILILALLFSVFSYGQNITTVHFNYKWNDNNTYRGLDRLRNTKVQYAFVEDQSDAIKKSIKSVPTIMIYKDSRPVAKFEAGLTMEITIRLDSIQAVINKHKR